MIRIIGICLALMITGCSNLPESVSYGPEVSENSRLLVDQYHIGVDDQVQVNVWRHPDLSITVPVRPDGKISVPLVGEVLAGGKTPTEVSEDITQKLTKFIRDPQVAVILVELRSHEFLSRVRVTGAVRAPRSLNFRQGMTILDVVLEAGGLNEFAAGNSTKLFRKINGKIESIDIDMFDILNDGDMRTNIAIEPGDIISVPERTF
ncbi:XrtA/PEP-CTERM system exopolysaccharide export protein [Aliikangiella sp. G2MR2-5]|uniref:XrtA/PEP-CTERM system exopolysaccharide export protein n=1 Tax=Aliikangiella sp. G2MR2-5 TaxID=2788943 RepID=UPI0018AA83FC|nr:XrtA/PEP-CTERM system exopolysaccharide export protein [Aliikangiella sp. G2MR2-5]